MSRVIAFAEGTAPAPAEKKRVVKLNFAEDFVLSGFAAVTSKTISAPIERIKMVVQNQDEMIRQGRLERPFKGIVDCTRWIYEKEGFAAFWRSNFTNCIRYFPTQALNFSFKGQVKRLDALKPSKKDSYGLALTKNITAGGLAGGGSLLFVYSLDYARTRLANDLKGKGGERQFTGIIDVYRKTLAADGIAGLYRGFVISFVGIFVYRGMYFGLYDTVMPILGNETPLLVRFAVGYVVTVVAGLASYPIDTIRRRMMMTSGTGVKYNGSIDCAVQIWKKEGIKSYFKGAGANILRGIAGAGVLAGFDFVQQFYVTTVYGPDCVSAGISGGG
jgi:solute carrier family 25 (adenine nucleotide translocator) protein 4/5/6/31